MNDKKDDRPDSEKGPFADSIEMFDSLFEEKSTDEEVKPAPVGEGKGQTIKGSSSKKKVVKKIKQPSPNKPGIEKPATEQKTAKTLSLERSPKISNVLKIILTCVLLAVLAVFFTTYFGIVDYKKYFQISEISEQKRITKSIKTKPSEKTAVKVPDTVPHTKEKPEIHEAYPAIKDKPAMAQKPPEPIPPHKAKEGLAEKEISYPYSIYLGSYSNLNRTQKAVSGYRKNGLSPYWVKIDLGDKGVWFRLFAGYFQKRDLSDAYIKENKIKGAESKKTFYANLIGSYESEDDLNAKSLALIELGYSPYVIPGINKESRLYTGAFYQKARAEEQKRGAVIQGYTVSGR